MVRFFDIFRYYFIINTVWFFNYRFIPHLKLFLEHMEQPSLSNYTVQSVIYCTYLIKRKLLRIKYTVFTVYCMSEQLNFFYVGYILYIQYSTLYFLRKSSWCYYNFSSSAYVILVKSADFTIKINFNQPVHERRKTVSFNQPFL